VFIVVDKILDDLDKEKKDTIDIFGFVKDMRTRRVNMVQTAVSIYQSSLQNSRKSMISQ
jgi:protein tyrosine phosphatase